MTNKKEATIKEAMKIFRLLEKSDKPCAIAFMQGMLMKAGRNKSA